MMVKPHPSHFRIGVMFLKRSSLICSECLHKIAGNDAIITESSSVYYWLRRRLLWSVRMELIVLMQTSVLGVLC